MLAEFDSIYELIMNETSGQAGKLERYRVLIVDDYPDNLLFVSELLEQNGIDVIFATSGPEALEAAREQIPDLVLLDISMPDMDGYQICRKLKADPITYIIPVLFLTAKVETDDIIRGFDAGGVDYITKPFNIMELLSRVRTHLDLKDRHDKLHLMNSKLIEIVKKRNIELLEANERLSKLDKAKNDFLLHINHQLRTPLNGILGYADLLMRSPLSEDQYEFVREINKLVERLVKLSERSLLFTELRADTYKLNIQPLEASLLINKAVQGVSVRYPEKSIDVINQLLTDGFKILVDENLILRCFSIILDNAFKYSPNNLEILIKGHAEENFKVIEIIDRGPGISEDNKEKIFEMFTNQNQSDNDHGFGLGLATAKLIMDIQSAEIDIYNHPLGGTVVKLVFYHWSPALG